MLIGANTLRGYKLRDTDGEFRTVDGFRFDDHHWVVRYLVAETADSLDARTVLISPYAIRSTNKRDRYISISLTRLQIDGKRRDSRLRDAKAVIGYSLHASDGDIGDVDDFVIDDETRDIRFLVIDTHDLWPGKKVLISPQWIQRVSWPDSKVFVQLSRETIKRSPEYSEASLLTRNYEIGLHRYYNSHGHGAENQGLLDERFV
jgi:hypothetical protein